MWPRDREFSYSDEEDEDSSSGSRDAREVNRDRYSDEHDVRERASSKISVEALAHLYDLLNGNAGPTSFAITHERQNLVQPGITVADNGIIPLPLVELQA